MRIDYPRSDTPERWAASRCGQALDASYGTRCDGTAAHRCDGCGAKVCSMHVFENRVLNKLELCPACAKKDVERPLVALLERAVGGVSVNTLGAAELQPNVRRWWARLTTTRHG